MDRFSTDRLKLYLLLSVQFISVISYSHHTRHPDEMKIVGRIATVDDELYRTNDEVGGYVVSMRDVVTVASTVAVVVMGRVRVRGGGVCFVENSQIRTFAQPRADNRSVKI